MINHAPKLALLISDPLLLANSLSLQGLIRVATDESRSWTEVFSVSPGALSI